MPRSTINISRRELLAGAGAGAVALLLEPRGLQAQATSSRTVVFAHTTVVNVDAVQNDVALAVEGDKIVAIGPTDTILKTYPDAEVYDVLRTLSRDHVPEIIETGRWEDRAFEVMVPSQPEFLHRWPHDGLRST